VGSTWRSRMTDKNYHSPGSEVMYKGNTWTVERQAGRWVKISRHGVEKIVKPKQLRKVEYE